MLAQQAVVRENSYTTCPEADAEKKQMDQLKEGMKRAYVEGHGIQREHPEWLDTMVAEAEAKIQDRKQTKEMQLQTIKRIREEQQAKLANQAGQGTQAGQAKQPGQGTQAGQKNPEKPKPAKEKM